MIPQWIKDTIKVIVAFVLYSLGRRDATNERDAKESRSDLDWRIGMEEKREAIRNRYDYIRTRTPSDWDSVYRVREESEVQPVGKTRKATGN